MALFTVFAYQRRPPALSPVLDALTAASPVQPERVLHATLPGRRPVHAHVLATTTACYAPEAQIEVGRSLTVLHGYVLDEVVLTAAEVAGRFAGGVDLAAVDDWGGDHAVCHVDAEGVVTAFSDLHRVQSVFYVDTPWVFGVSTRPSMLRLLAGDPGWDGSALASNTAAGYPFGEATVHAGVRAVPQGTAIRYDGSHVSFLQRDRVVAAPGERGLDLSDPWTTRQLDRGIERAVRTVQLAGADGRPVELAITGGKALSSARSASCSAPRRPRVRARGITSPASLLRRFRAPARAAGAEPNHHLRWSSTSSAGPSARS